VIEARCGGQLWGETNTQTEVYMYVDQVCRHTLAGGALVRKWAQGRGQDVEGHGRAEGRDVRGHARWRDCLLQAVLFVRWRRGLHDLCMHETRL
jgi:hypothetical protein